MSEYKRGEESIKPHVKGKKTQPERLRSQQAYKEKVRARGLEFVTIKVPREDVQMMYDIAQIQRVKRGKLLDTDPRA